MIDKKDIDRYIKAKKEQRVIVVFQFLSMLFLCLLVLLEALGIVHDYTVFLATMSLAFMVAANGGSGWISVSRRQLLGIIGNMMSSDPLALVQLAEKRSRKRQ